MSINNEDLAPRWELGDAITIRLDPDDDPEATDPEPTEAEADDAAP